jgi:hypothetical protein
VDVAPRWSAVRGVHRVRVDVRSADEQNARAAAAEGQDIASPSPCVAIAASAFAAWLARLVSRRRVSVAADDVSPLCSSSCAVLDRRRRARRRGRPLAAFDVQTHTRQAPRECRKTRRTRSRTRPSSSRWC